MKINDPQGFLESVKDDKHKKLIFDFCDLLNKKYGIESQIDVVHHDLHGLIGYCSLMFQAPFYDMFAEDKLATCHNNLSIAGFSWRRLYNYIFCKNYKLISFNPYSIGCVLRFNLCYYLYSTLNKSFEDIKFDVDFESVVLKFVPELSSHPATPQLKEVS